MLEWQTESSLLVLRVRGKQWYWVYKFEVKNLLNSQKHNISIGNESYQSLQKYTVLDLLKISSVHTLSNSFNFVNNWGNPNSLKQALAINTTFEQHLPDFLPTSTLNGVNADFKSPLIKKLPQTSVVNYTGISSIPTSNNMPSLTGKFTSSTINVITPEIDNLTKRSNSLNQSVVLKSDLAKLNTVTVSHLISLPEVLKEPTNNFYLVLKQKRFSNLNLTSLSNKANSFESIFSDKYLKQSHLSNNKTPNFVSNKRLLRTKRILVLPINFNITVITNSFDVMHS